MILDRTEYTLLVNDILHGSPAEPYIDEVNDTTRHHFHEWKGNDRVHFFNINRGKELVEDVELYNFSFDYAAKCSKEDAEAIAEKIRKWRTTSGPECRKVYDEVIESLDQHDNFIAFWV